MKAFSFPVTERPVFIRKIKLIYASQCSDSNNTL